MPNNFIKKAIEIAKKTKQDVPVGCVIVKDGQIIASAHNLKEETNDITSHAEIVALREASKNLGNWRLDGCDLYVTLEPCPMCAWAIINSRIKSVYFGSYDTKYGAILSNQGVLKLSDRKIETYGGIEEDSCNALLRDYFLELRKK